MLLDAVSQVGQFRLSLLERGIGLLDRCLGPAAPKNRDGEGHTRGEGAVRIPGPRPGRTIVAIELHSREPLGDSGAPGRLGGAHQRGRALVIGTILEGLLEGLLHRQLRRRGVGRLVGQRERLANRKPDRARQSQLLLLELVLVEDDALLLGLHLHLRAQHVDARDHARLLQIHRPLVQHLRRVEARSRRVDPRPARDGLQIQPGDSQHHDIARVLVREPGRPKTLGAGSRLVQRTEVQDGLGNRKPRVEHVERPDNRRDPREIPEAVRLQVDLLSHVGDAGEDVGQESAPRGDPRRLGRPRSLLSQEQAQVLPQPAGDRIFQAESQRRCGTLPAWDAAQERTLGSWRAHLGPAGPQSAQRQQNE